MTEVLYGSRERLVRRIGEVKLIDTMTEENFGVNELWQNWRLRKLKPEPLAILNPPKDIRAPNGIEPKEGYFLLFDERSLWGGKISAVWERWMTKYNIKPIHLPPWTEEEIQTYLLQNSEGITFTNEAAAWYSRAVGTSIDRMVNELDKLKIVGITNVGLRDATILIGGIDALKNERLLKELGTKAACKLSLQVPEDRAISLIAYLGKALEYRRNSWWLALQAIRKGADLKRYDYWTGVQMFVHYCYQTKKSTREADILLDLMKLSGLAGEI